MEKSVNDKGQYALYDQGKFIGWTDVDTIDGITVIKNIKPVILQMKDAALKDGVILKLAAGLRTYQEQYNLRQQNVIDKSKITNDTYLKEAASNFFSPATGKPGWSNHQDGLAYDFTTKDSQGNLIVGPKAPYTWLVKNAFKFGFIRTVLSERWHWEYFPNEKNMFRFVPKTNNTWDKIV